jgi:hypothetical protein
LRHALLVTMSVMASACAHPPSSTAPRNPRRSSAQVADQKRVPYVGVSGVVKADTLQRRRNPETFSFALYSRVPRIKAPSAAHALVVNHRYWGDWVFWTSARLENQSLRFATLELNVLDCTPRSGCGRDEGFMLAISDAALRAHRSGFDVRLYSKTRRERVLRVTSTMIGEQLRVVDSVRAARAR